MGTLKGSTGRFLISVPKVIILQGVQMDLICLISHMVKNQRQQKKLI